MQTGGQKDKLLVWEFPRLSFEITKPHFFSWKFSWKNSAVVLLHVKSDFPLPVKGGTHCKFIGSTWDCDSFQQNLLCSWNEEKFSPVALGLLGHEPFTQVSSESLQTTSLERRMQIENWVKFSPSIVENTFLTFWYNQRENRTYRHHSTLPKQKSA